MRIYLEYINFIMAEETKESRVLVTGSPGAGKSTLCKFAIREGRAVIDTDDRSILSWGKGELPHGASFLYLLRNPPRFNWGELDKKFRDNPGAIAYGSVPPMPRELLRATSKEHFDRIEYLSLPVVHVAERLGNRDDNPFGTTKTQVATSMVYAFVLNTFARIASFIDKDRVRVHDARKSPEQLLKEIIEK